MNETISERRAPTEKWHTLMDVISRAAALDRTLTYPLVLTSLPELPEYGVDGPAISFIHGPPGRNIALATGLKAAVPDAPILLIMNADAVTLGMNHLIHASRRNMDMTLLMLRSDVTDLMRETPVRRTSWRVPELQQSIEARATPLELATDLEAASVSRGNLDDVEQLAELIAGAMKTPGFSVVGITSDPELPTGVLSRSDRASYFESYRSWAASVRASITDTDSDDVPAAMIEQRPFDVPRQEFRIAGLGGQGVKLAGAVLNEAMGTFEGLWTTMRGEYGSATRGGPSLVDVVAGSERVGYPGADTPDVLVLLTSDTAPASVKAGGVLIVDENQVNPVPAGALTVPIIQISVEHTGKPLAAGIVSLGCIAAVTSLVSLDALARSIAQKLPAQLVDRNMAALMAGYEQTTETLKGESHE